jgi:hypothetical protein
MCLTCTPAKEVQLFPAGLGLYSGIFVMYYLQRSSDSDNLKSKTAYIIFYALCVLYILSTVNVVIDLVGNTPGFAVSNNSICKNITFLKFSCERQRSLTASLALRLLIVQSTVNGCCDFLAQCILVRINHCIRVYHSFYSLKLSKIYRCWIVWGQNIRVVIVPSFLAIAFLGQSETPSQSILI